MDGEVEKFDGYAVVELFGHQRIAGRVSEQVIAGQGFIRVDVPTIGEMKGFTRLFGPGAIYSIIPTDEEVVQRVLFHIRPRPIEPFYLKSKEEIEEERQEYDLLSEDSPF